MRIYSVEDVRLIREGYGVVPLSELARSLGRSQSSVSFKVRSLGLTTDWRERRGCREWSEAEVQWLREMFPVMRTVDMARTIGRTVKSIGGKARKLGLAGSTAHDAMDVRCKQRRRRAWTEQEVETLRRLYPDAHIDELVRVLGRSRASIEHKASVSGIAKSEMYLWAIGRESLTNLPEDLQQVIALKRNLVRRINEHDRQTT
ncbi:hypothetical protein C7402_112217 [Paraburkholderia unamae]|uniref:Uncharacterized protein n=2 Tax=Paraburkholderia unamae TaxID=219649 RepID=A0ABX5KNP8_9BURK|nr:hypothetical protein C7402_112217 [Paraburkholderia unamae]